MAFHGGKGRKYYVWYLGWKECRYLRGQDNVLPIAKALVSRRGSSDIPTLTLEFTKKELKVVQEKEKRKGKIEKIKYPPIPIKDITFACKVQNDIVCCVYLGFNPKTQCAVHVHVYRFDTSTTANCFLEDTRSILDSTANQERLRKVEEELIASGQIDDMRLQRNQASVPNVQNIQLEYMPLSANEYRREMHLPRYSSGSIGVEDCPSNSQNEEGKQTLFNSVNDELRAKLNLDTAPILLPPKDYDTVRRKHGHLDGIEERKSQQIPIVGERGAVLTDDPPQRSNQSNKNVQNITSTTSKLVLTKRDSLESRQDSGIGAPNDFPSPLSDHSGQHFPDPELGRDIGDSDSGTIDLKMVTPAWKKPDMYRYPTGTSPPPTGVQVQSDNPVSYSRRSSQGSSYSAQGSHLASGKPASRNASFKSDSSSEHIRQGPSARNASFTDAGETRINGNLQRRLSNTSGQSDHGITRNSDGDGNERPHSRSLSEQHDYRYVKTHSAEIPDQRYLLTKDQRSPISEKPDPRYMESKRKNSSEAGLYSYYK